MKKVKMEGEKRDRPKYGTCGAIAVTEYEMGYCQEIGIYVNRQQEGCDNHTQYRNMPIGFNKWRENRR